MFRQSWECQRCGRVHSNTNPTCFCSEAAGAQLTTDNLKFPNFIDIRDLISKIDNIERDIKLIKDAVNIKETVQESENLDNMLELKVNDIFCNEKRIRNILNYEGIKTLKDLISFSPFEVLKFADLGPRSLLIIHDKLKQYNVYLGMLKKEES